MMDLEWIRDLVELVEESGVDSLEVSRFWTHVKIRKSPEGAGMPTVASAPPPRAAGDVSPPGGSAEAGGRTGDTERAAAEAGGDTGDDGAGEDLHEVESPMVGTFYRAPAPDAPPYVETGDRVEKGQTLCILEAMKLMNELESEVAGVVREILVENAEPVEYGQVLFRIDTSSG
jgi:acetyl-CoA carboxylase biotin carboxyl carrier protein